MNEVSKLHAATIAAAAAMAAIGSTALAANIGIGKLLAWHLIANATIFAVAALAPLSGRDIGRPLVAILAMLLVRLVLLAFGSLDLILAAEALFVGRTQTLWLVVLAIPGAVGCYRAVEGTLTERESESAADGAASTDPAKRRLIPRIVVSSSEGRPAPLATLLSYAVRAAVTAMWLALALLAFALGIFYWQILSNGVFSGGDLSIEEAMSVLREMLRRLLPYFVVLPAVYALVDLTSGAVKAFDEWRLLRQGGKVERELSDAEVQYVGETVDALDRFLTEKKYPSVYGLAYWFGFVAVAALIGVAGYGLSQMLPGMWEHLKALRTAGTNTLYYSGGAPAGGMVLSIFAAIFLVWAIFQAAIFVAPEFAEYMYAREGWNSMTPRAREAIEFAPFIVRQLRAGALRLGKQADLPELIRAAFRQHEAVIFGGTSFLWLLVGILCYLDISWYTRITVDKIKFTDYWTARQTEIPYSAVDHVETSCRLNKDGEVLVGYDIYFDRRHSDDLIGSSDLKSDILRAIPIDEKLRSAGVRVSRAAGFEQDCLDSLRTKLDEDSYAKAERLLRPDGTR